MIVVSNTSPVINLAAIDKVELIKQKKANLLLIDERKGRTLQIDLI